jgi:hypothetical protein
VAKNERTGSKAASLAGKALAGEKLTPAQVKTVAASALTQVADKAKATGKKR